MDLGLVKFINSDLTWGAVRKGHRSMRRRPRETKASGSEFGFHSGSMTRDSVVSDHEKSGVAILGQHFAEEVLEVPIKKRILLLQAPGQRARSPQPKTPSPHHEPPIGREHASEATKPAEKAVPNLNDFSGIELLAAAACHSSGHVEEHSTPRVESYPDGIKQDISPMDSVDSSVHDNTSPVTQNYCDNGNVESDRSPAPTKVARLHWDLNTVMEEWEEPCDILVDPHSEKEYLQDVHNDGLQNEIRKSQVTGDEEGSLLSGEPDIVSTLVKTDGGCLGETYNAESCLSKSDLVDSLADSAKCETVSTSIASVSLEEITIKVESDDKQVVSEVVQGGSLSLKGDTDDKLTLEGHLSDCCGSNLSQDKVTSGYDSPAEDGELREPATHTWEKEESEEMECVDYESDDMYEDNSDAIESVTNEIAVDHLQTMKESVSVPNNDIGQGSNDDKADALVSKQSQSVILEEKDSSSKKFTPERKNSSCIDRPTTSSCIRRSRLERDFGQEKFTGREGSSYYAVHLVDSFSRNSHGSGRYPRQKNVRPCGSSSIDNNEAINYNPRGVYRNGTYGIHSGTLPSRDIRRDRARVGLGRATQEEYNNPDPCYSNRKVPSLALNLNRGANLSRTQKRSRSGSPIAWHFQKKRDMDSKRQGPDFKSDTRFPSRKPSESEAGFVSQTTGRASLQCASRSFDDRNVTNEQYRDRRTSPVGAFHRTHQRHDSSGYLGKMKSNDHFRPRVPLGHNYSSIHDDKYGMMNERRRFRFDDDDESFKAYSRNKDNGFRYTRIESKCFREPRNTSEEKGCRYTANKMFSSGEGHFYKDN